ncbi:hypothetical protein [Nitrosomonas sp.]|uniref:hypothetical protein n=1 Tax=Nitrosomonas sp. TaxID=42353 RepID=UPI0025EFD694|nr:hypothetical protein [Nitrosomonas sp.]
METSHSRVHGAFAYWTSISYRYALWVLLAALLIAVASSIYISRNLGMNSALTALVDFASFNVFIASGHCQHGYPAYCGTCFYTHLYVDHIACVVTNPVRESRFLGRIASEQCLTGR